MSTHYTSADIALIRTNHIKAYGDWYTKKDEEKYSKRDEVKCIKRNEIKISGFEWLYGKPKEENKEVK